MEYVVDGIDLSIRLGISDLDVLSMSTRLTSQELESYRAQELCGLSKPSNQFASGRLILYGCHCGCDYCGVISCVATCEDDMLVWGDIRGEDFCEEITPIQKLVFPAKQVIDAIECLKSASQETHRKPLKK
jgi:hypothetical protein